MTPAEFKSWFGGFVEAMENRPTDKQWTRIKERVAEIDGQPVTERHFIDRYWPTYVPTYIPVPMYPSYPRPYWGGVGYGSTNSVCNNTLGASGPNLNSQNLEYQYLLNANSEFAPQSVQTFNSSAALCDLGRKDYAELN